MTDNEYEALNKFIHELLYEKLNDDDYDLIMTRLGGNLNRKTMRYRSICHGGDGYNLAYYSETKSFTCFSHCGCSYSLLSLVKKIRKDKGLDDRTIPTLKWICEQVGIEFNFKEEITTKQNDIYKWQNSLSQFLPKNRAKSELKTYDKAILDRFDKVYHQSWIDDNISIESMEKYQIFYYYANDSIGIPCLDKDGNLIGIRQRFTLEDSECKYMPLTLLDGTSFKFPTNQTLYGLNHNAPNIKHYKKVVLVEAEKGVMQTDTMFHCKNYAVALYGHAMSEEKAKQILEFEPNEVILAIDFDYETVYNENGEFTKEFELFYKTAYKIGDYFKAYCDVSILVSYGGHKLKASPTDMGKEKYLELFENREHLYDTEES